MRSDMADVHSPHALGDSPAVVGEQPNASSLHHGTVPRVSPDPHANSLVQRARSETVPVWVLLPLRAFMGFTFVFAGLQKLASRSFFTAGAPGSIQEQLQASYRTTPVRFLVSPALHAPVAFGIVIALAEIAVGLGVALGLLGRLAAAGGMLLSLLFFLTVSFNTWPYYYGSDIVFLFAWTPLLLAGSGPLSLDAVLQRSARKLKQPDDVPVEGDVGRRLLLRQAGAAGAVAACGLFLAGVTAAIGRATSKSTSLATGPGLSPVGGGSRDRLLRPGRHLPPRAQAQAPRLLCPRRKEPGSARHPASRSVELRASRIPLQGNPHTSSNRPPASTSHSVPYARTWGARSDFKPGPHPSSCARAMAPSSTPPRER